MPNAKAAIFRAPSCRWMIFSRTGGGAITKIGGLLGIKWPAFDEASAAAIDAFLSPDLRHQNAAADSLPPVFAWTIKAYEAMLTLRDRPQSSLALSALDEVNSTFELACAFMGPAFAEVEKRAAQAETEAAAICRGARRIDPQI
ncbi:protein of unknown function [Methylocella tundrae]|uniref:Uncharacterized protein n=1 Tax=Methylocella tundrae TaxID=227605 RepID=A0A4U8YWR7_METTU|nr:protein of unknown function [Methylocella tundrae]